MQVDWEQIADAYSSIEEDRERILLPPILSVLEKISGRRIVDVGGGDGRFLEAISSLLEIRQEERTLALTDPSARMRQLARKRFGQSKGRVPKLVSSPSDLSPRSFDVALLIATWMGIPHRDQCVKLLKEIHHILGDNGLLIAAVTHPCFRDRTFRTYSTSFEMHNYHVNGKPFLANLYDGTRSISLTDYHWSLSEHVQQLMSAGFYIQEMIEPHDEGPEGEGAPWLIMVCQKITNREFDIVEPTSGKV